MKRKLNQSDILLIETLLEATQKNKIDWEKLADSWSGGNYYIFKRNPQITYTVYYEWLAESYITISNPENVDCHGTPRDFAKIYIPLKYRKLVKEIKRYHEEKLIAKRKEEEDARFLSANRMLASAYSDIEALRKELGLDVLHEGFNP